MNPPFPSKTHVNKYCMVLLCLLISPVLWANTLRSMNIAQLPDDKFEVRMTFDTPPAEPKGYTIELPARIVLDFAHAESGLKERSFPMSQRNCKSAMILTSEGNMRLILNLNELATYATRIEGNTCIIDVGAGKGMQAPLTSRPR